MSDTKNLCGYQFFCYPVYCHFFKFCLLPFHAALEECTSVGADLAKTRSQPSVQLLCLPLHLNNWIHHSLLQQMFDWTFEVKMKWNLLFSKVQTALPALSVCSRIEHITDKGMYHSMWMFCSLDCYTLHFWPLNPKVATDNNSNFHFKSACLHLCGTAFSF